MVDYTKRTGSTGMMTIRDTGTVVEFWITANNNTTANPNLPWYGIVDGQNTGWQVYNYPLNGGWRKLRSWTVTTNQTVTFTLGETPTIGFGGPTTLTAVINRGSPPPKPKPWTIKDISASYVDGESLGNGNGGSPITRTEVGYGTSSAGPTNFVDIPTSGAGRVGGLKLNVTYYFWVRNFNARGASPWSDRTQARTNSVPPAPSAPVLSDIQQTWIHTKFTLNGTGGSEILKYQTGYGKDPNRPTLFLDFYEVTTKGMTPGTRYYYWGRVLNQYGWSPWSARSTAVTLAGSWVYMANGTPKRALIYVKHNGAWKIAESRIKIAGVWKKGG